MWLSSSTGSSAFAGEALPFSVNVTNSGDSDSGPVTVSDKLPAANELAGTTCGTTPNCTVSTTTNAVTFTLSSVAAGAELQMSLVSVVRAGRDFYDRASWTGGGCAKLCHAAMLVIPIDPSPVELSSNPPNRSYVATGDLITYTVSISPESDVSGDANLTITDAIPTKLTYVVNSASCGTTPGCTASEAGHTVTFVLAAGSATSTESVSFEALVGKRIGTINDRAAWTGGSCASTCRAGSGTALNAT